MPDGGPISISPARTSQDLQAIRTLFTAYAQALGIDLSFQNFHSELASLPGKYATPTGELLLAKDTNGHAIGCVALRPLSLPGNSPSERVCEMKRLYISPAGRGLGLGRRLVLAIIDAAESSGYAEIRLDTLPEMVEARGLYKSLGFEETGAYYETPIPGTHFLALRL